MRFSLRSTLTTNSVDELPIDDVDVDDPAFEALLVGRKVKVLLQDVDRVRWRQDLAEDHNRLEALVAAARLVIPTRDAKLAALRRVIADKVSSPINAGQSKDSSVHGLRRHGGLSLSRIGALGARRARPTQRNCQRRRIEPDDVAGRARRHEQHSECFLSAVQRNVRPNLRQRVKSIF